MRGTNNARRQDLQRGRRRQKDREKEKEKVGCIPSTQNRFQKGQFGTI